MSLLPEGGWRFAARQPNQLVIPGRGLLKALTIRLPLNQKLLEQTSDVVCADRVNQLV